MNSIIRVFVAAALIPGVFVADTSAQGTITFQNLNFEQAIVPVIPPGQSGADVSVTNGLPGWTAYIGASQIGSIFHNDVSIGAAAVSILGPQWFPSQILEGSYTVYLQPSTAGPVTTAAIGQTGQIPATAASIRFYGNGGYTLTFAGQPIPLVSLGASASYTIFGGDISGYANQTGELRFQGGGLLDNIFFSNQAIPEPSTFGLFGLGILLFVLRSRPLTRS